MVTDHEHQPVASIAGSMAAMGVRNTMREDIHASVELVGRPRDLAGVMAIEAAARNIHWPEVSRTGHREMGHSMRRLVDRPHAFQAKAGGLHVKVATGRALDEAGR